jgi:hypothetical protein
MIDIDIVVFALLVFQVVLLVVHAVAQRREIGRLNRRLSTLGTEVGLLKAKRKTQRPPAEADTPMVAYPGIAYNSSPVDLSLLDYRHVTKGSPQYFSPSWI